MNEHDRVTADCRYPIKDEWLLVSLLASGREMDRFAVLEQVHDRDIYDTQARMVFKVVEDTIRSGYMPTPEIVDIGLRTKYGEERGGNVNDRLLDEAIKNFGVAASPGIIEGTISRIVDGSKRRLTERLGMALVSGAKSDEADIEALWDEIRTEMRNNVDDQGKWISGVEAMELAYKAAQRNDKPIPTGFDELDMLLCGGLMRPELTIVGARPGKGKSAFLLACANNAAKAGKHVCYFSLEMSAEQIGQRVIASESRVSVSKQRMSSLLTDSDMKAMSNAIGNMKGADYGRYAHIYTVYGLTIEKLATLAQNAKERGELDLLVVDYLQLLKTTQKTRSDFERLGIVSKEMKALSLMLDVPILTAAQVRRQNNAGGPQRAPGLDELRGSGDLEQDADNVLLIHVPEDPADETLKNLPSNHANIWNRAENSVLDGVKPFTVDVAKQRQGANGRTWHFFRPKTMQFWEDAKYDNHNNSGKWKEADDATWVFEAQEEIRV